MDVLGGGGGLPLAEGVIELSWYPIVPGIVPFPSTGGPPDGLPRV